MYNIPVLFIFFNRPEVSKKAFEKIQLLKPEKLYLACDGPRSNNTEDIIKIQECRKLITSMVTWKCDLHTRFLDENLGCSLGVSTAISWVFEKEEYCIILEDDCIADNCFFTFCSELLQKYKNDYRIGMIAGHNKLMQFKTKDSYIFSKYKACWGWATWKRAWSNFDLKMEWRNSNLKESILSNMGYRSKDVNYWKYRLKMIDIKEVSAWDWQWYFSMASQNQLCIFPQKNLISNIGFGKNATHTLLNKAVLSTDAISFPLCHPDYVVVDNAFDKLFYKKNNTLFYKIMRFVPICIKHLIKNILRKMK